MEKPKVVIFDIDGTLLDIFPAHITAYKKSINNRYNVEIDENILTDAFGLPEDDCYRAALKPHNIIPSESDLATLKQQRSAALLEEVAKGIEDYLLPGVKDLLEFVKENQIPIAYISGNNKTIGKAIVKYSNLSQYSTTTAFGDEIPEGENRSFMINLALKRGSIQATGKEVYVVGDSIHDINAAKENGNMAIGIATYKTTSEQLKEAGADFTFKNCNEFKQSLERLM